MIKKNTCAQLITPRSIGSEKDLNRGNHRAHRAHVWWAHRGTDTSNWML